MLDRRFAESFLDQPTFHVLGRRLRPFSLYHYFGLELIESPFLAADPATPIDLELASRICACRYGDIRASLFKNSFLRQLRWIVRLRYSNWDSEAATFAAYLHAHLALPEFWKKEETKHSPFPLSLSLAASLLRHSHLSEREVWMMPFARAYWYVTAFTMQDGLAPDLVSPEEESLLDQAPGENHG